MILSMCSINVKVIQLRIKVKLACQSSKNISGYNYRTIGRIKTKINVRVDIDEATNTWFSEIPTFFCFPAFLNIQEIHWS